MPPESAPTSTYAAQCAETRIVLERMSMLKPGDARRERLREAVIQSNLHYARHIAALYSASGVPDEATFEAARRGLILAVDGFVPGSADFLTFATPLIIRQVRAGRPGNVRGLCARGRMRQVADALPGSADRLARDLGRSPTIPELADAMDASPEEIVNSLDTALGYAESRPEAGGRPPQNHGLAPEIGHQELKALLAPLPERNKRIVMMRYLRGMTDAQIGAELGISPVHVSRLLAQALGALRAAGPGPA